MNVRYHMPGIIVLGLLIAAGVVLAAFLLRKRNIRKRSVRVANTERLKALPVYRRKKWESRIVKILTTAAVIAALIFALLLTARPFRRDTLKKDVTRRDIFLCLDLSSSGFKAAEALVPEIKELVPNLDGDRIGISLFNTTSSLYVPETDDYDFVVQRLDELDHYLKAEDEFETDYASKYDYASDIPENERTRYDELNSILSTFDEGITAGYASKGTSVIGEGLASCLFSFPEIQEEERTRILIFATDNKDECTGDPLVTLSGAAEMCSKDGVVVFGIYPAETNDENADADREAMREAVEGTGGKFYTLSDTLTAEEILSDIRSREAVRTKTVSTTRDTDLPERYFPYLVLAFAVAAGCAVFLKAGRFLRGRRFLKNENREADGRKYERGNRNAEYGRETRRRESEENGGEKKRREPRNIRRRMLSWVMIAAMTACVAVVGVRPMVFDNAEDISTNNLDVCFVVDTTISMWAEDYNGKKTRMEGVRNDIDRIMQALPDSSFSLIRFDNGAQILTPFTQDISAVTKAMKNLTMPSYASAAGSSLNTSYVALASMLTSSSKKTGRRTVVFFMSDGEITDGSTLMSFSSLRDLVDDGAVLGYGTSAGGRMNYPNRGYIKDTVKRTDAKSKIDEANLEEIASDLGVDYIHITGPDNAELETALTRVRMMSSELSRAEGDLTGYRDIYYYFSGILVFLLLIWLFFLILRGGVA